MNPSRRETGARFLVDARCDGAVHHGTVVGDAVVTAQRLESTDKVAHDFDEQPCRVLLSEATYSLLAGHDDVGSYQPMGQISLKGKAALIGVYRMNTGE